MPKETIETLVSELVHEEDWRRMRATAACLSGGPRAVQALIHALQCGSPALEAEAAAMLARVNDPQAGVPLVGLLRDEDEAVRKAGASALEHMAGARAKRDHEVHFNKLADEAQEGLRHNNLRPAYRVIRQLAGRSISQPPFVVHKINGSSCELTEDVRSTLSL